MQLRLQSYRTGVDCGATAVRGRRDAGAPDRDADDPVRVRREGVQAGARLHGPDLRQVVVAPGHRGRAVNLVPGHLACAGEEHH